MDIAVVINTAVAYLELFFFLLLLARVFYHSVGMLDCVIYAYVCQIFNYKFLGGIPWFAVSGVKIFPGDFLLVTMLLLMMARGFGFRSQLHTLLFSVFLIMALQAAVRGFLLCGFSSEFLGDLRKFLYFGVAVLYFSVMPLPTMDEKFWKKMDTVFWCITVYMWIVLVFYFAGFPLGDRASVRPLLADYAIVYTVFVAVRWYRDLILSQTPKLSMTTLLFTATLILNRFNTTWAALAVAVLILLIARAWDKNHRPLTLPFYMQIALMAVVAFVVMRYGGFVSEQLVETTEKFNANRENTFSSRIELWQALMGTVHGHHAWIGYPFGNGFHAIYRGSQWQATPHNGYIETLLRTGYPGLVALVTSMITVIGRAFRKRNILPIMICAACMTFWVGYSLTLEQGVLIGICVQAVFRRNPYDQLAGVRPLQKQSLPTGQKNQK